MNTHKKRLQDAAFALILSIAIHAAALAAPIFPNAPQTSRASHQKPQALRMTFAAPQASSAALKSTAPARAPASRPDSAEPPQKNTPASKTIIGAVLQNRTEGETRDAAPQNAKPNYLAKLKEHFLPHRRYPEQARLWRFQGTAHVRFSLNRQGKVVSRTLHKSSGHRVLDQEALALLLRAQPMPPPPLSPEENLFHITIPILFTLR